MQNDIMKEPREVDGKVLRKYREAAGLSHEQMAERMRQKTGVKWQPRHVEQVETGVSGLSMWCHQDWCEIVGVRQDTVRREVADEMHRRAVGDGPCPALSLGCTIHSAEVPHVQ